MVVTYKKQHKKFSFFFKISMVFLIVGIVLHILDWTFWGELSYFACCAVMLVGIVYIILHHITYFTGKKIERVISLLFYTGIACLIMRLISSLIFKEDYYMGISPFMEVHSIVISCLKIGTIFLPLSVVIMLLKYKKLFKFLNLFS
ncbi:MAG: hypothetical protein HDR24_02775 [Lachnospiraceae bacterium]|nr:hypothetical protein [Lachnospiraceae bacterium]